MSLKKLSLWKIKLVQRRLEEEEVDPHAQVDKKEVGKGKERREVEKQAGENVRGQQKSRRATETNGQRWKSRVQGAET